MSAIVPVLIVGAGPTGLTLAVALRHHGIDVRLIDRNPAPAPVSKALAVWSGSMEALAGLGVVDDFLAAGVRMNAVIVGDGSRQLAALKIGDGIDSPYPYPLLLPQSRTEAILGARAAALGVPVERGVELTGLSQDADGVTATLHHADGHDETVSAGYLVGADGARSTVRHALDVAFEGDTEPQLFLLGDVQIGGGGLDGHSIYIWWHNGSTVALFPFENEVWRIIAARPDSADESQPTLAELQDQMDRHGPPGTRLHDPSWLSSFRTNERLAARYRDGRVFLAGDAAHIHSPAGGQGMNTGIQDATNLAWKLAHVLQNRGSADLLLDSYEAERRPVARHVIDAAAQKLHAAFAGNPLMRIVRDVAVTIVGHLPAVQKMLQIDLSETDITYRDGPLVALGDPPRRTRRTDVGTRARDAQWIDPATGAAASLWPQLAGTHHTLLVFEDTPMSLAGVPLDENLRCVRIGPASDPDGAVRARYHMDGPGWVLVRPDQVVAARGEAGDFAGLNAYLDRVMAPRSGAAV